MNIFFDKDCPEQELRHGSFAGDIYVYAPRSATQELCDFALRMMNEAFAPLDPCRAQYEMPAEDFAALLAELKPKFMHDAQVKRILQRILTQFGYDLEKTYFDIPRMRTMTHGDYLRTGIALAVPPHRDTWFGGAESQLNWWMPVAGVTPENTMVFHPEYFANPVANTSSGYDHETWKQQSRKEAVKHVKNDTREYPRATEEINHHGDIRLLPPVGGALIFAGSQLHSTSPNTSGMTRFSVDFRTIHIDDITGRIAAPNVDNEATGSTLAEYLRASDFAPLPEAVVNAWRRAPSIVAV
jgi:hypothetical protein